MNVWRKLFLFVGLLFVIAFALNTFLELSKTTSKTSNKIHISQSFFFNAELHPHAPEYISEVQLLSFLWTPLVRVEANGEISSALAEKWEKDQKNLSWRFFLKPNLKWSDGSTLDAKQIVYSLNQSIKNNPLGFLAGVIKKIIHVSNREIKIDLKKEAPKLPAWLGHPIHVILDPSLSLLERTDRVSLLQDKFKFSGPYQLGEINKSFLEFTPNPYFEYKDIRPLPLKIQSNLHISQVVDDLLNRRADLGIFWDDQLSMDHMNQLLLKNYKKYSEPESSWINILRFGTSLIHKLSPQERRALFYRLWSGINSDDNSQNRTVYSFTFFKDANPILLKQISNLSRYDFNVKTTINLFVRNTHVNNKTFRELLYLIKEKKLPIKIETYDPTDQNSENTKKVLLRKFDLLFVIYTRSTTDPDSLWRMLLDSLPQVLWVPKTKKSISEINTEPSEEKRQQFFEELELQNIRNPLFIPLRHSEANLWVHQHLAPGDSGPYDVIPQYWRFKLLEL